MSGVEPIIELPCSFSFLLVVVFFAKLRTCSRHRVQTKSSDKGRMLSVSGASGQSTKQPKTAQKGTGRMKRRDFCRGFLTAGTVAGLATFAADSVRADSPESGREFVELRKYTVKDDAKRKVLVETLDGTLIPALNRQGIKPVGVFLPIESEEKYRQNIFVVIPHQTTDSFLTLTKKLLADETYRKDAAFFCTNSKDPVYETCENSLLYGFETCPKLETPSLGPDRFFQIRLYRSFNIERNAAKIDMFEHGGELALFRKLGMNPIFFGDALVGRKLPNLTYMIGCESREKHDAAWKEFVKHPDWIKMRDLPQYADTATAIDRVLLKPSPGSQI